MSDNEKWKQVLSTDEERRRFEKVKAARAKREAQIQQERQFRLNFQRKHPIVYVACVLLVALAVCLMEHIKSILYFLLLGFMAYIYGGLDMVFELSFIALTILGILYMSNKN